MKTSEFNFDLVESLIAQSPSTERGQSRLMILDREAKSREHRMVSDLPLFLEKGTLVVFNNSKVRKARLFGTSDNTGLKAEFLLLEKLDDFSWKVLVKRSKRKKSGSLYHFDDEVRAILSGKPPGEFLLRFDRPIDDRWLDRFGHTPLPPYIKRKDTEMDSRRYQTIYAEQTGSAAAPTAGLHFTEELLVELDNAGMEKVFITLHVGLGTFLPVRTENIEDHTMHEEAYFIGEEETEKILKAKKEKRKILAIGTTSLRCLESAWKDGFLQPGKFDKCGKYATSIFIYPGFKFNVVDHLFTNFHTPKSTLLMLVSAFAGKDLILDAYQEAVKEEYRFFSYGDAMLIR